MPRKINPFQLISYADQKPNSEPEGEAGRG